MPISNTQLFKNIVASYNDDADFGAKASQQVADHFASLPPSKSKSDPQRMGTRATFISKLRHALHDQAGSLELNRPETAEFDALSPKEQYRFQKLAKKVGHPRWILDVDVIPANIQSLQLPED